MSRDDETKDGKNGIPLELVPFIGIAKATPEQLLYVVENGNGIQSSLVPQSNMDGMNWSKSQQENWKSRRHHGRHHGSGDDWLSDLVDYIAETFMPFLRSVVGRGYDSICSSCSKFFNYFQMRGPALGHEWNVASAHMDTATANAGKSPDADNFLDLQRAHLQKMAVGTRIIMHGAAKTGKSNDYKPAYNDSLQLAQFDHQLGDLQEQLAGKTESEKQAILQQAFPDLWDQYKAGNLKGAQIGGTALPSQDLGGIAQPFLTALKDVFAAAGRVLYGDPASEWSPSAGPKSQPQPT